MCRYFSNATRGRIPTTASGPKETKVKACSSIMQSGCFQNFPRPITLQGSEGLNGG
jgi:hypothetical protein